MRSELDACTLNLIMLSLPSLAAAKTCSWSLVAKKVETGIDEHQPSAQMEAGRKEAVAR